MNKWAGLVVLGTAIAVAATGCGTEPTAHRASRFAPAHAASRVRTETAAVFRTESNGRVKPTTWTATKSSRPLTDDQFSMTSRADPISNFTSASPNGVWFWNDARNGDYLFHITASTVTKWRLPQKGHPSSEMAPGIAQAANGVVWLGIDQTIYSLNPRTSKAQAFKMPAPTQDPAAPHPGTAPTAIDALAVSPSGTVAVAERWANETTELNPSTGAVTEIKMPNTKRDEPFSVAFNTNGVLAVGFGDFDPTSREQDVLLVSSGREHVVRLRRAGAGLAVTADGRDFFSGLAPAEIVDASSRTSSLTTTPAGLHSNSESPQTLLRHDGDFYGATSYSVVDFAPGSKTVKNTWRLPKSATYTCPPFTGPVPPTATTSASPTPTPTPTASPTSQTCRYEIQFYEVDASGNVWVLTDADNTGTVDLLKPRN